MSSLYKLIEDGKVPETVKYVKGSLDDYAYCVLFTIIPQIPELRPWYEKLSVINDAAPFICHPEVIASEYGITVGEWGLLTESLQTHVKTVAEDFLAGKMPLQELVALLIDWIVTIEAQRKGLLNLHTH